MSGTRQHVSAADAARVRTHIVSHACASECVRAAREQLKHRDGSLSLVMPSKRKPAHILPCNNLNDLADRAGQHRTNDDQEGIRDVK